MMKRTRAGFTLIELLVVIAIIAILAAILFPIFVSAQERGRLSGCYSNLKEIAMAFQMYCDEFDGKVPFAADAEDKHDRYAVPSVGFPWPYPWVVMKKYCRGHRVWQCPADKGLTFFRADAGGTGWPAKIKNCYDMWGSSYSYRTAMVVKGWDSSAANYSNIKPCVVGQFRRASRVAIFFDALEYSATTPPGPSDWNAQWHHFKYPMMGWNMAFADGHARLITKEELYHPKDNPYKTWLLSDYYIRPEYPK